EVALVEDDAAGGPGVGVEAQAEQQAAGALLLHGNQDVLDRAVGAVLDGRHGRPDARLGVDREQAQAGQGGLGDAQLGGGQDLARVDAELAEDDVHPGRRVAADVDLADAGRRPLLDVVEDPALAGVLGEDDALLHAGLAAAVADVVAHAGHVALDLGLV